MRQDGASGAQMVSSFDGTNRYRAGLEHDHSTSASPTRGQRLRKAGTAADQVVETLGRLDARDMVAPKTLRHHNDAHVGRPQSWRAGGTTARESCFKPMVRRRAARA